MAELEPIKDTIDKLKSQPKKKGGARPGSGRPKGSKNADTITREAAARIFKERVARNVDKLFAAQLDKALGEKYLMVVTTTGSGKTAKRETTIVTDTELIKQYIDDDFDSNMGEENEYYFMTTKPASTSAIDSLLNRSFGKAAESLDVTSNGETLTNMIAMPPKKSEQYDTDNMASK